MAAQQRLERARKGSYKEVLSTSSGRDLLDDLVIFAQSCTDPVRALGRADVVLRMMREKTRIKETESEDEHSS